MPEPVCKGLGEALSAFLDGEMEDAERREIEVHLSVCLECRTRWEAERSVRSLVRERKGRLAEPAPEDLRRRIVKAVQMEETQRRWDALSRRRMVGRLALAASLVLCVLGGMFYFYSGEPSKSVVSEVVDEHIRCLMMQDGGLNFVTADPGAMSEWFRSRVGISVSVPAFPESDLRLEGGRLSYLLDRVGAQMVYLEGAHVICLFVFDGRDLSLPHAVRAGYPIRLTSYKGYNVAVWVDRGLVHALVGDVPRGNLKVLATSTLKT